MAHGPGKYDIECGAARLTAEAEGALLIIINGQHGSGFSCQASPQVMLRLPEVLESIAAQIRADLQNKRA